MREILKFEPHTSEDGGTDHAQLQSSARVQLNLTVNAGPAGRGAPFVFVLDAIKLN